MTPLLILTHGEFGPVLLKAAESMFGPQSDAVALGLAADETREDFQAKVHAARTQLPSEPLVLVDLACGTPWNVAVLDGCADAGEVLAGLNLPMLLESLELRQDMDPKALAKELKARASQGFVQASQLIAERGNGGCA
jgi:mannose/fructose-specific phosphotransferase system component IIA